ncbi:MAG: nuclear transport factor 2 family protein [Alphaproteobacteria bacterium]|nr:nuclear transport factor 2 family protein [Alphaproteobacteria bacterium]
MSDAIDDLFRRFGKAWAKGDGPAIAACVTEDFEWRQGAGPAPAGRVVRGRAALEAEFAAGSKKPREVKISEARIHRAGDHLFGTFRMTGIDADGKPFDRYGLDVYQVRDGLIALKDSYGKLL